MAFFAYNTDDPNATAQGYLNVLANGVVTVGPLRTDVAARAAGSFFCDRAGTLQIQQSFDYLLPGGDVNANAHWDVVQFPVGLTTPGTTVANTAYTIDSDCIAPYLQVVFTNGAAGTTTHIRLFLRVFSVAARG